MKKALDSVLEERKRQTEKWGEENLDLFLYSAILGEEYGEFQQALVDAFFLPSDENKDKERLREEAVQTAAVALSIVECIDRGKWKWGLAERIIEKERPRIEYTGPCIVIRNRLNLPAHEIPDCVNGKWCDACGVPVALGWRMNKKGQFERRLDENANS